MAEKLQEYSLTWEVTDEMTAKRIGSAGSQILSTPNMVALMEAAALELAKSYLEEGQTTVGARSIIRAYTAKKKMAVTASIGM